MRVHKVAMHVMLWPVKDVCCGLIDQRFSDLLLVVAIETVMPFGAKWCCSHLVCVGQG